MKENLLRIKINSKSLIKFSKQHAGRDFLLSYPITYQGTTEIESHITFHTPNGRRTFKITSLKNKDNELIPKKLFSKGLDLFNKLELLEFKDSTEIYPWAKISLNLKDSSLDKYFKSPKTPDNEFKHVKNIIIPEPKEDKVTIKFGIAKNFTGNRDKFNEKYDDLVIIDNQNHEGNAYTFFFFIEYNFPQIENRE